MIPLDCCAPSWRIALLLALLASPFLFTKPAPAAPLLPDLFAWEDESRDYMHNGSFDLETIQNRVLYRFIGALPNIGHGPLEIREETDPDGTQTVYQRIYDTEVFMTERVVGIFENAAPTFGHLWLEGIAQYNLRTVLPGGGVGEIVSTQDKTSMAVIDGAKYDTSLPGAPLDEFYEEPEDPILGISIGWADLYRAALPGQWVDVTGLADGEYWLEVVADPYNRIEELDDTNNTTRILVNLTIPDPRIMPGDYNDDGSVDAADYTVWRDTLGDSADAGTGADGSGNGLVDPADYEFWKARFGNVAAGGVGSARATIPEPSTILIVLTSLAMLGCHHHVRQSKIAKPTYETRFNSAG